MTPIIPSVKNRVVLGMTMLAGMCLSAVAAVLPYETNFQTTPGSYIVNQTVVGQQNWLLYTGAASGAMVIDDPTGSGHGQLLSLSNAGGARNYFQNTIPGLADIVLSYQTYADSATNVRDRIAWLNVMDNASSQIAGVAINASGNIVLNGTNVVTGITPSLDTWYTVTLTIKRATQTLDLFVTDGISSGSVSNVSYQFPSTTNQLGMMGFFSGVYNPDALVYLDNISVAAVPEPAVSALLGLGVIGLVAYRRRKLLAAK